MNIKYERKYTVEMTEKDYNDLLAILAYTGGLVEYGPHAVQHNNLKTLAKGIHFELSTGAD